MDSKHRAEILLDAAAEKIDRDSVEHAERVRTVQTLMTDLERALVSERAEGERLRTELGRVRGEWADCKEKLAIPVQELPEGWVWCPMCENFGPEQPDPLNPTVLIDARDDDAVNRECQRMMLMAAKACHALMSRGGRQEVGEILVRQFGDDWVPSDGDSALRASLHELADYWDRGLNAQGFADVLRLRLATP